MGGAMLHCAHQCGTYRWAGDRYDTHERGVRVYPGLEVAEEEIEASTYPI